MQHMLDQLCKNLCDRIGLKPILVLLSDGIYHMHFDNQDVNIYFYTTQVAQRICSDESYRRTIHIDEDILTSKFDAVQSRLEALLGYATKIHARKTVVARIDKAMAMAFQQEHHLQVALAGKYRYGLFAQGDLVSVAIFSGGRKMNNKPADYRSFELLRFCHKRHVLVVGGLSKLIGAFAKDFHPGDIMTYVDRDWTQQSSLTAIGFEEVHRIAPQVFDVTADSRRSPHINETAAPDDNRDKDRITVKQNSGSTKMVLRVQNHP